MTAGKRTMDLFLASLGLLLALPIFAIAGIALRLEGRGGVFFRQVRVGRHGRPFRIWKFRTMADAPEPAMVLTVAGDPRITRVGAWLRDWKLDELPQLLNVLRGEMSLVGPRPEVPRYVARYTPEQRRVLDLTPGITDPASLRFRSESDRLAQHIDPEDAYLRQVLPEKLSISLDYAARATRWSDLRVLWQTVRRIALGGGPGRQRPGPAELAGR
jgi:lipopolysaccharide/colanic/teichoic acid biosynthesis glycosyltransferase